MDTIFKIRITAVIALLIMGAMPALGQTISRAEWSRVKMDSSYDGKKGKATKVIEKHRAESPALLKTAGKCEKGMKYAQLQGFATDIMLDYAARRLSRSTKNPEAKADLAIAGFKSSKVSIKAGEVTPLDIISLFPMDNQIVLFELEGKYVKELLKNRSKKRAVSSIDKNSIEDGRMYTVITTDDLFREDESADVLEHAEKVHTTNMFLSNVIVQHIQTLARKGETF